MALDNGDCCLFRNYHIQVIRVRKPNNSFKPTPLRGAA
ncbi:hypothetical protein STPYR_12626 [uncultured Stenotrophomonas sp.]|uniref:Uncharacterized protein n=1 Tax=uncultured Stenotrophomonas sp. TaxID=165438 RepID=A0A1Y5Q624_9GAMM|nr:hypothetical protein STPYR_12626 [uncultured Stenotrophomonas sp.]